MTFETIIIHNREGYAIIQLNNGKVNVLNKAITDEVSAALSEMKMDDSIKGIIISGRPHCFCAGLDVVALATGGDEYVRDFWRSNFQMMLDLIHFPKPVVCAITGFAPAAGTILALCSDYRIMGKGDKHVLGMNEFKMSLSIPELYCDIYAYALGEDRAFALMQQAALYNSDIALDLGLIHESIEVDHVLNRAEEYMAQILQVDTDAFIETRNLTKKGLVKHTAADMPRWMEAIEKSMLSPKTKQKFDFFMASLKAKKS